MTPQDERSGHGGDPKSVSILIDGEPYEAPDNEETANAILSLAGLSTTENYLVEIKGKHQESYQGQGEKLVHLHKGSTFISVFFGPTPVSDTGSVSDA